MDVIDGRKLTLIPSLPKSTIHPVNFSFSSLRTFQESTGELQRANQQLQNVEALLQACNRHVLKEMLNTFALSLFFCEKYEQYMVRTGRNVPRNCDIWAHA
uniref:Uncharacterized protein n=1 Tax=Angiostrongylus cantonensis TaxID=6313 RepID=A0A0K0DL75_ANGCA